MPLTGRVLVLGDNSLACLAVVRSLARAGLTVDLVSWYESRVTRSSRYVHRIYRFGDPEEHPAEFVEGVLKAVSETAYDMVFPVLDAAMTPLMEVADELNRRTIFAAPDRFGYDTTHDKAQTVKLAMELGVDVPKTRVLTNPTEIETLELPGAFPLILKPVFSGRVRKVRTVGQLRESLRVMLERSPVLVQEFCLGRGIGVEVLCDHGEVVAAFQHERVHEPPGGGASSYRKSVPLEEPLLAVARTMSRRMNFTGPAMFEFKRAFGSGRAPLMEINGRFWGSLALSIYAGVNFPKLLYDLLAKRERINVFSYRVPRFARSTAHDVFWFTVNARTPAGDPQILRVSLPDLLREPWNILSGRECWDVESISDPMPGVHNWVRIGAEIRRRFGAKLWGAYLNRLIRANVGQVRNRVPAMVNRLKSARSVLFLCYGNINRSSFAEYLVRTKLNSTEELKVKSAGFFSDTGRGAPLTAVETATQFGVDLSEHRSCVVDREMLSGSDLIFVMDASQIEMLRKIDPSCLERTVLLGALDTTSQNYTIQDPHATDAETYAKVFEKIARCVDAWLDLRNVDSNPA